MVGCIRLCARFFIREREITDGCGKIYGHPGIFRADTRSAPTVTVRWRGQQRSAPAMLEQVGKMEKIMETGRFSGRTQGPPRRDCFPAGERRGNRAGMTPPSGRTTPGPCLWLGRSLPGIPKEFKKTVWSADYLDRTQKSRRKDFRKLSGEAELYGIAVPCSRIARAKGRLQQG